MADALLGGIIINEVLPDPNSAVSGGGPRYDTDHSGTVTPTDEFIEIMNHSNVPLNIGGMQLWDQTLGKYFTFPAGTILQPGAHAMVMTGTAGGPGPTLGPNDFAFYAGRGSAVLNNGPENTILYHPGTNEYIQIAYGGAGIVTPGTPGNFAGFPAGSTRVGAGENFGAFIPGQSIQREPDGSNTFDNGTTPTPGTTNVCFASGTGIATPTGLRRIEDLVAGDLVRLQDGRDVPIRWIGSRQFTAAALAENPALWPIRILPGALGPNVPKRALRVSRQHRICVSGKLAQRMTGQSHVLLAAHLLVGLDGVDAVLPQEGIRYFHLLLPEHSVVMAENTPAESLYLGSEAQKALSEEALAELTLIFPDRPWQRTAPAPAYPLLRGRRALKLVERHRKNHLPLVA